MKKILPTIFVSFIALGFLSSHTARLPTSLKITVLNSLGNPVADASVTLYGSEDDYRDEKNAVSETLMTNEKGQVIFKKLESKIYFVHVVKEKMNNDGGAAQTNKLESGKQNKVNIVIE